MPLLVVTLGIGHDPEYRLRSAAAHPDEVGRLLLPVQKHNLQTTFSSFGPECTSHANTTRNSFGLFFPPSMDAESLCQQSTVAPDISKKQFLIRTLQQIVVCAPDVHDRIL
jgi:hypothetical protein